jgi:hypothetical protein
MVRVTANFGCTATEVWHPVKLLDPQHAESWLAPGIPANAAKLVEVPCGVYIIIRPLRDMAQSRLIERS